MAKGSNQKLKMLYLLKILSEKTDESHCLSAQELIGELQKYEVSAERKSIYNDIECLTDFGYDIVNKKAKTGGGYYLASREFELPELKLLVDAVQSSRFITQKKSRELIHKIETLAGPYEAKKLQRQVFVASRIKTENESIYYNVDHIHNAIQDNVPISFIYMEWNAKKEFVPRHNGKEYRVSPWALTWKEENYYLVAFDDEEEKIKHFRVDKMNRIRELEGQVRKGSEEFRKFDIAEYTNQSFGMFGGETQRVTLQLSDTLSGVLFDRFGKEIDVRKISEDEISARISVCVSPQFFGWLTGLGSRIKITAPADVTRQYQEFLHEILERYDCCSESDKN